MNIEQIPILNGQITLKVVKIDKCSGANRAHFPRSQLGNQTQSSCQVWFGVYACETGHTCYTSKVFNIGKRSKLKVAVINTAIKCLLRAPV